MSRYSGQVDGLREGDEQLKHGRRLGVIERRFEWGITYTRASTGQRLQLSKPPQEYLRVGNGVIKESGSNRRSCWGFTAQHMSIQYFHILTYQRNQGKPFSKPYIGKRHVMDKVGKAKEMTSKSDVRSCCQIFEVCLYPTFAKTVHVY